jgi:hypothetical protein
MMTTTRVLCGLAAAVATVIGAMGCSSTSEPPPQPETHCYGYKDFGYWHKEEPNQVTVCTDGTKTGKLEFKDANGQPLPGGGLFSGPGCVTIPVPPAQSSIDWTAVGREGEPLPEQLIASPLTPFAVPVGLLPKQGTEYVFGCSTIVAPIDSIGRWYWFEAVATSLSEAQGLVDPLLYHGVGNPLPSQVRVGYLIEAELVGFDLVIRSSLHDRFGHFRVDVEGNPVADLATGLNVQSVAAGSRWTTVTATIPISMLSETMDISIQQQGQNDPHALQMSFDY